MQLTLTPELKEALLEALSLAIEDQEHYLDYGNPKADYGDEWQEVAETKAARAEQWAALADQLNYRATAAGARQLAANFRDNADTGNDEDTIGHCTIHTDTKCVLDGSLAVICPKCAGTPEGDSRL